MDSAQGKEGVSFCGKSGHFERGELDRLGDANAISVSEIVEVHSSEATPPVSPYFLIWDFDSRERASNGRRKSHPISKWTCKTEEGAAEKDLHLHPHLHP